MKNFISILASVFSIVGAIVGAGFMSGAEINQFFSRFGKLEYLSVFLVAIIIGVCIFKVWQKNAKMSQFDAKSGSKLAILPFFQFFIAAAMVAGFGEIIESFGMQKHVGVFACMVLVFVCLMIGVKFANCVNILATILLLVLLPIVAKEATILSSQSDIQIDEKLAIISVCFSCFYCAMNLSTAHAIIENVTKDKSKRSVLAVASLSAVIVAALILAISAISRGSAGDMPMLDVIESGSLKIIYCVGLVFAMMSTLLSSSVGAKKLFDRFGKLTSSLLTTCLIVLVSFVGFSNIVKFVYPAIGASLITFYCSKFVIDFIFVKKLKSKENI